MNTSNNTMTNFSVLVLNRIQENWSWNPEQLTRCLRTLWKNNKCQDDKSLALVKTLLSKFESDIRMGGVNFRHTPAVVDIFCQAHTEVYTFNGMNEFERAVEEVSVSVPKADTTPLVVDIYTDGSQSSKTLCGGWAVVMTSNKGHSKELSGMKANTTNNEMELEAMIKALETLNYKQDMEVKIHSDSTYVLNALFSMEKFKQKGFGKAKNQDYLQRLMDAIENKGVSIEQSVTKVIGNKDLSSGDTVCKAGGISFIWVKGHADSEGNNKVDILAVEARKEAEKVSQTSFGTVGAEEVQEGSVGELEALVASAKTFNDIKKILSYSKKLEEGGTYSEEFTCYTEVKWEGKKIFEIVSPELATFRESYIRDAVQQLLPYLKEEGIYSV